MDNIKLKTETFLANNNKRQSFRSPVGVNFIAHIKNKEDYKNFNGFITDISMSGVGIGFGNLPKLDQFIEVSFNFPNIDLKLENLKATVKWQRKDLNRLGAKWVDLKEKDRSILKYLVSENT